MTPLRDICRLIKMVNVDVQSWILGMKKCKLRRLNPQQNVNYHVVSN